MLKAILIVLVLVSIVPAVSVYVYADKDDLTQHDVDVLCDATEDYEAHKEQCDKLYDKVQDATLAFASKDDDEYNDKEDYSETEEWNEKDYEETMKKHERDENDLKDNENEDACYYEGFRVDNDNSFCD